MSNQQCEKSRQIVDGRYHKPFEDLEVFHVGNLTNELAKQIVPPSWWVMERSNYGDFYVARDMDAAYRFMDRQINRFWRLAYWGYQQFYGIDVDMSDRLKLRGIWITPAEYDQHPELKEVA